MVHVLRVITHARSPRQRPASAIRMQTYWFSGDIYERSGSLLQMLLCKPADEEEDDGHPNPRASTHLVLYVRRNYLEVQQIFLKRYKTKQNTREN